MSKREDQLKEVVKRLKNSNEIKLFISLYWPGAAKKTMELFVEKVMDICKFNNFKEMIENINREDIKKSLYDNLSKMKIGIGIKTLDSIYSKMEQNLKIISMFKEEKHD